jgi:inosine/xanthosine triphosphate pyrophosphatase family protein
MYFLTGNANKLREAKAILGDHIQQLDIDLPEIQSLDSQEIIQHKIDSALQHFNNIAACEAIESRTHGRGEIHEVGRGFQFFVEDTSLIFHALGDFP